MTQLPTGWVNTTLSAVAEVRLGRQRSPKRATGERMRPYLRAANVGWLGLKLNDVKEMDFTESESLTYELKPGDLLLAEASGSAGEVGKPGQYRGEIEGCCFQNTLIRVRLESGLLPDFYEHFFREQALNRRFAEGSRGVGIHHLGAAALSTWPTPVPPTAEQERIGAAIEEAFSLLDAGEAGLHATRTRLKRMRDSVLAAAVTGQLVPQDPTDMPAASLLGDLGIASSAGPRSLPPGWATAPLGEVTRLVPGSTPKGLDSRNDPAGEVPFLKVGDLASAKRVLVDSRTRLSKEVAIELRVRTCPAGTLVFPKNGGAIATNRKRILGVPAAFDLNTMGLVPKGSLGSWMWIWLLQLDLRPLSDGSIVPQINRSDMEPIQVPIPPAAEQARIVAAVDWQFSFIEAADRAVDAALVRSAGLRRSVLKAAFEGRLVPQEPSDEPAAVLLERIAAERAAAPKASRRGRAKVEAS